MTDYSRPARWSYSAISTYEGCPAQYKYSYLDKLPSGSSPAAARGTRIHSLCESYVKGELPHIPNDMRKIGLQLEDMRQRQASTEAVWLLDREWKPTDNSGAWIKGIVDIHYVDRDVLKIIDFKTGRQYPEHVSQLELYALMGLSVYPEAKRAEYSALYVDDGCYGALGGIIRQMWEPLKERWSDRAQAMYADEEFQARPGSSCRWCNYSRSKGGPCQVGI